MTLKHHGIDWTEFVTGELTAWSDATKGLFSSNKSNEIARSVKSPPTSYIGDKRYVDAGVFREWQRRIGTGEIVITLEDLRAVREAGKGRPRGRPARLAALAQAQAS